MLQVFADEIYLDRFEIRCHEVDSGGLRSSSSASLPQIIATMLCGAMVIIFRLWGGFMSITYVILYVKQ